MGKRGEAKQEEKELLEGAWQRGRREEKMNDEKETKRGGEEKGIEGY